MDIDKLAEEIEEWVQSEAFEKGNYYSLVDASAPNPEDRLFEYVATDEVMKRKDITEHSRRLKH